MAFFLQTSNADFPRTPKQWTTELQRVKILYLQRQYKQCAARAEDLLMAAREPTHPIHKTYLFFYSAISYEVLGRAAHTYSANKLAFLQSALDCFTACGAVLPTGSGCSSVVGDDTGTTAASTAMTAGEEEDASDDSLETMLVGDDGSLCGSAVNTPESSFLDDDMSASPMGGLVGNLTRIIDDSMAWPEDDPFVSNNAEGYGELESPIATDLRNSVRFKLPREESSKTLLIPSPLQIRKSSGDFTSTETPGHRDTTKSGKDRSRPPPLPLKIVPLGQSHEHARTTSAPKLTNNQEHSCNKNNTPSNDIHVLHAQITNSISTLTALIDEITALQRARKVAKSTSLRRAASFWSFSPIASLPDVEQDSKRNSPSPSPPAGFGVGSGTRMESKQERIQRLRAEGWKTVGLRNSRRGWKGAEYYERFCREVLGELGSLI